MYNMLSNKYYIKNMIIFVNNCQNHTSTHIIMYYYCNSYRDTIADTVNCNKHIKRSMLNNYQSFNLNRFYNQ